MGILGIVIPATEKIKLGGALYRVQTSNAQTAPIFVDATIGKSHNMALILTYMTKYI